MRNIWLGAVVSIGFAILLSITAFSEEIPDTFDIDNIDWQFPSEFRKGNWITLVNIHEDDILDICIEDDAGAVAWFATKKGLFRYNLIESRWESFTVVDGLTDNEFSGFGISPEYIIATGISGLNLFNRQTAEWSTITLPNIGFRPSEVKEIEIDGNMIWLALSGPAGAIWQYNMNIKEWRRFYLANSLSVNAIAVGKKFVFAGGSGGIHVYDKQPKIWESFPQNESLPSLDVKKLLISREELFLGLGRGGVFQFNTRTGELTKLNIGGDIIALADDGEYLNIASEEGIARYNKTTGARKALISPSIEEQYFRVQNCAFGRRFTWIVKNYSDPMQVASGILPLSPIVPQEGTEVWRRQSAKIRKSQSMEGYYLEIRDNKSQISRLFKIEKTAPPRRINSIATSGDVLWTTGQGLASYNSGDDTWNNYSLDGEYTIITAAAIDGNEIWYAAENPKCAIYRYSVDTVKTVSYTKRDILPVQFNTISVIKPDRDYVWFGGQTGVIRYDKRSRKWSVLSTSLYVQTIALDGQRIWINNASFPRDSNRLFKPQSYREYDKSAVDEDSIWMVTKDDGVWIYDKPRRLWADLVVEGDYLHNHPWLQHIEAIVPFGENVWLGTSYGLIRYEKNSGIFYQYTVKDGLLDNYLKDIAIGNRFIWALTSKGICGLDKSKIKEIASSGKYRTQLNYKKHSWIKNKLSQPTTSPRRR